MSQLPSHVDGTEKARDTDRIVFTAAKALMQGVCSSFRARAWLETEVIDWSDARSPPSGPAYLDYSQGQLQELNRPTLFHSIGLQPYVIRESGNRATAYTAVETKDSFSKIVLDADEASAESRPRGDTRGDELWRCVLRLSVQTFAEDQPQLETPTWMLPTHRGPPPEALCLDQTTD